ncbi:MAG: ribosomal-protein-alanine N-acetyltransferase [Ruminococcaceae bacterium]|nr:ribosomal-protein-alanine N-acetyltransferase [Oscillospiraceae bacterium]
MIVSMNENHIAQIAKMEKLCFSDPWSERSIASELENELSFWLVYEQDGRVLGYVGSQSVPPESDVMNLAVLPECRKQGIAQALLCELMHNLRKKEIDSLTLEVRASNLPAISLYEKLGFISVGRRPKYYVNPKEDALIMRRELTDADIIR